jgi:hypothetical protein
MVVTGTPFGLVSVSGYRFPLHDPVARRVGSAADPDTTQAALTRSGSIRSRWPPSATAAIEA